MCVCICVCVHVCVFVCVCVRVRACVVCMYVKKSPEHDVFWGTARKCILESVFREFHPPFSPFYPTLQPLPSPPIHCLSAHHLGRIFSPEYFCSHRKRPPSPPFEFFVALTEKT